MYVSAMPGGSGTTRFVSLDIPMIDDGCVGGGVRSGGGYGAVSGGQLSIQ